MNALIRLCGAVASVSASALLAPRPSGVKDARDALTVADAGMSLPGRKPSPWLLPSLEGRSPLGAAAVSPAAKTAAQLGSRSTGGRACAGSGL